MDKLCVGAGVFAEHFAFFHEVNDEVELLEGHIVLEIPVEPISLLNEDIPSLS
jgi:hypothetical protein